MGTLPHRLAAVVIIDLVGFLRLMSEDETGTLASLRAHRNAIDPVVLNHGGRLVKTTGDGMLLEFPSATDALGACVAMLQSRVPSADNLSTPGEVAERSKALAC